MEFVKYQHVERYGTDETDGIEQGTCYVFPKIDGTNGSVWLDNGVVKAGSRNRELSLEQDNAGFYAAVLQDEKIKAFLLEYPNVRLFGEWLVPHTIKTYNDKAWRKFYVFDVMIDDTYVCYDIYQEWLEKHGIEYIPCIAIVEHGSDAQFIKVLDMNQYLIQDGLGIGEGIVIKRYGWINKYGRVTWAKIVTSEFKAKHCKTMGSPILEGELTAERRMVDDFCTPEMIEKEKAKVSINGWNSKLIPQLLGTVYNCLVTESMWEAIKKYKNPTIDFGKLQKLCYEKVKLFF